MADIKQYLDKIRMAIFGEEVRGSIIDAITAMNNESSQAKNEATTAEEQARVSANAATVSEQRAVEAATHSAKIDRMTVSASKLNAGATPTVTISDDGTKKHLTFGIPKGDTGATGVTPSISMTVSTGAEGTNASITKTGTAENPAFALVIPRGDTGAQGPIGNTPNVTAMVTTGAAGSNASVTTSGTSDNPVLNFTIPRGDTGFTPDISISAVTGNPGTEASVVKSGTAENPEFAFTIPRGDTGEKGDTGATPQITVNAETGAPGSEVSVTQSGTAEAPVLTFTIPKGDTGSLGNLTVNGKAPDASGSVTLTPEDVGALPSGGTADNSGKLGGKAPEYYVQPVNLLDNSDFSNPVAQAGLNGMHGNQLYPIDRWFSDAGLTVAQHSGYIRTTVTAAKCHIRQNIPKDLVAGKQITIAAKIASVNRTILGVYYVADGVTKSIDFGAMGVNGVAVASGLIPANADGINVRYYPDYTSTDGYSDIYWIALYEGTYTAETLPPYRPKGYAAELAECMRYYENSWYGGRTKNARNQMYATVWEANNADGYVPYKMPKRIVPTVSFYPCEDYENWTVYRNNQFPVKSVMSLPRTGIHGLIFRINRGETDTVNWTFGDTLEVAGIWEASADL